MIILQPYKKKSAMEKGYYSLIEMAKYRESLDYKKALEIQKKKLIVFL